MYIIFFCIYLCMSNFIRCSQAPHVTKDFFKKKFNNKINTSNNPFFFIYDNQRIQSASSSDSELSRPTIYNTLPPEAKIIRPHGRPIIILKSNTPNIPTDNNSLNLNMHVDSNLSHATMQLTTHDTQNSFLTAANSAMMNTNTSPMSAKATLISAITHQSSANSACATKNEIRRTIIRQHDPYKGCTIIRTAEQNSNNLQTSQL